jgi:hypothetical protein
MNIGFNKYLINLRGHLNFRFHWSSEIYSFGKIHRQWLGVPKYFPLLFTSDHGVNLGRAIDPNIFDRPKRFIPHLTWNSHIVEASDFPRQLRRKGIIHPWVYWRLRNVINPEPLENRKGSVLFISHSSGGSTTEGFNDKSMVDYLFGLPKTLFPISVCIYHGDLSRAERINIFEKHGFECLTLGDPWEPTFVNKFYSLLSTKKLLISQSYGSQIPLACEFGIPVLLIGQEAREIDLESKMPKEYKSEDLKLLADSENFVKLLFKEIHEIPTQSQLEWSRDKIGISYLNRMKILRVQLLTMSFLLIPIWFVSRIVIGNLRIVIGMVWKDLKQKAWKKMMTSSAHTDFHGSP